MTDSVFDKARDMGIEVRGQSGGYNTTCPKCSHTRKKKGDRCLWVTVENDRVLWKCFHCDFKGGLIDGCNDTSKRLDRPKRTRSRSGFWDDASPNRDERKRTLAKDTVQGFWGDS